ncbi:MAG: EAL domain-containing protein [Novosphingobium sp.]
MFKLGQPIDHIYWNNLFRHIGVDAPQSIIVVTMGEQGKDAADAQADGALASAIDAVSAQAPKKIYIDGPVNFAPNSANAAKIRSMGSKLTLVARPSDIDNFSSDAIRLPNRNVVGDANVVFSAWYMNFLHYAQGSPNTISIGDKTYSAFAVDLAGESKAEAGYFIPNFAVDPDTIRTVSASQLVSGSVESGLFTGRSVIITTSRMAAGKEIGHFGHGLVNPVVLDIAGAASVSKGRSSNVSDLPELLLFVLGILACSRIRRVGLRRLCYGAVATMLVVGPAITQNFGFYPPPSTGIFALSLFGGIKLWGKWRRRVLQTSASGLPNFFALSNISLQPEHDIVVAVIGRYEEFLATLPGHLHAECANQVARRFAVGSGTEQIYHGEGGVFAWIERAWPADQQTEHFEGMRALFSAPLLVGGHMFDTNVHFGLDRNYQLDTVTRLNTALSSANSAMKAGRTIEQFEASRLADAPWELSLLARIDEGMKNGDIWLAYQPQWDYRRACVSGAEALIRWNDPVRGPIRPDAFIVQAEKAGRIDALTYWVFEEAITAARAMKDVMPQFQMSINLSAQLVDKPSLISAISEIVRRRGIDCREFTIEVTETASVYNRPAAVQNLQQLRAMGFRLAIDDFGTGESSLLYLAELPSDELKIDQHFVSRILTGEREREIVKSTITLAHALKQSIVAEGIEDRATFDLLSRMGCDTGQGYFIGRPESFDQFRQTCMNLGLRDVGS